MQSPDRPTARAPLFALLGLLLWSSPCLAVWPFGGLRVSGGGDPVVVSNGTGGMIVAWTQGDLGSRDIYAQVLDATGSPLGDPGGVPLCSAAGDQTAPGIVDDGAGGAIVYWRDQRTGNPIDIYAQRITHDGTVAWMTDGVVINNEIGNQTNCTATADGAGGAIFTWQSGSPANIFAQRLDATGARLWTATGAPVCLATGTQQTPQVARTAAGGAVMAWLDNRASGSAIYAQELDNAGAALWAANGIPVYSGTGIRSTPRIATADHAEFFIAWQDQRSGGEGIYVQSLSPPGVLGWNPAGVRVTTAIPSTYGIVPRGTSNGMFIAWTFNLEVAVDIVTDAGALLNPGGPPVWAHLLPGNQSEVRLAVDGLGGAIVTWFDERSSSMDIFAQRFDAAGATQWLPPDGIPVAVGPDRKAELAAAAGDPAALLVAWADSRGPATAGLYAQSLHSSSLPMTHVVSSTTDSDLRGAIETANANPDVHHRIAFDIPGAGPHLIQPLTSLPSITASTVLDGLSQTGVVLNFASPGQPSTGTPLVQIAGDLVGGWGLDIAAPDCAVRGLAVRDFDGGGVRFGPGSQGSSIEACHIGADAGGLTAFPNGDGISIDGVAGPVYVGTQQATARNVIGGNTGVGVRVNNTAAVSIAGNHIGLGAGAAPLGNGGDGVRIGGSTPEVAIGHSAAQPNNSLPIPPGGNAVFHNGGDGIRIEESVGPSVHISANGTDGNTGHGIDTAEEGTNTGTPATSYTPQPALTTAFLSSTTTLDLVGSASGPPLAAVTLQVFAADACDASGFGEGARHVGALPLTLDASGNATISTTLTVQESNGLTATPGDAITAVLIVPGGPTSEFSSCSPANNTAAGTDVPLSLDVPGSGFGADLTFDEVTAVGATTFSVLGSGPPVPPNFQIGDPPVYYDISSTATFTGVVAVCIRYDESAIGIPETDLALLHYDQVSATLENVTTSVDTDDNVICGNVTSLSPFVIARQITVGVNEVPVLPTRVAFRAASAIPSRGATRFTLELPRTAAVELRIYDTAGRVIRTLASGQAWDAGVHAIEWPGDDEAGRPVPAGVYFAAGRAGDTTLGRRVVVLR